MNWNQTLQLHPKTPPKVWSLFFPFPFSSNPSLTLFSPMESFLLYLSLTSTQVAQVTAAWQQLLLAGFMTFSSVYVCAWMYIFHVCFNACLSQKRDANEHRLCPFKIIMFIMDKWSEPSVSNNNKNNIDLVRQINPGKENTSARQWVNHAWNKTLQT